MNRSGEPREVKMERTGSSSTGGGGPAAETGFEQAKLLFFEGLRCFESARHAEAEQHYLASLALLPGRVSTLVNLAAVQIELGRPADALATADGVLAVEPQNRDGWSHRATALARLLRLEDAFAAAEQVVAIDSLAPEGWLIRAEILERMIRPADALASYRKALAVAPDHAQAWSRYGGLLRELDRLDEAAQAFKAALQHGADPELHTYYLAAVEGRSMPRTAPRPYVQGLFDDYADAFDEHLVGQLQYQAHRVLAEPLASLARGRCASALDLGCGTGLCGPLVRPLVDRLTGVDVSARMLAKARALGVYDRLDNADLVEHLGRTDERHDLVLAADVFIYVGDLEPVFAGVRRVMTRGVFCFSVEQIAGQRDGFRLMTSLRYAHTEAYLRGLAACHGFGVLSMRQQPIRHDQRRPIDGLYVYLALA